MSNAAAVAVLMPITLAIASQYNIDPRMMTLAVTLPSGFAFMLPSSSPTIAIVVSSAYIPPLQAFNQGLLLKISGLIPFFSNESILFSLNGIGVINYECLVNYY